MHRGRGALGGVALWLGLLAAYAAVSGLDLAPGPARSAAELDLARLAERLAEDGTLDRGRPAAVGFLLLAAPAHLLGGTTGIELLCAAALALAFVLAIPLARRLVPDPWGPRAVVAAALSPPALAGAATIAPANVGAVGLVGAALLALRVRGDPRLGRASRAAGALALLPWVAPRLLVPGAIIGLALARWLRRRGKGLTSLIAFELVLTSAVVLVTVDERLYGSALPVSLDPGAASTYLERLPALGLVLAGPEVGLLRWAPILALALWAVVLLIRSVREQVALALPERVDVEVAATLLAFTCAAGLAVAALLAPEVDGPWRVPPDVLAIAPLAAALSAWGWQRAPRTGAALAALTLALSVVELVR